MSYFKGHSGDFNARMRNDLCEFLVSLYSTIDEGEYYKNKSKNWLTMDPSNIPELSIIDFLQSTANVRKPCEYTFYTCIDLDES